MNAWDAEMIRKLHQDKNLLETENDSLYLQLRQVCNENEVLRARINSLEASGQAELVAQNEALQMRITQLQLMLEREQAIFNRLTLLEPARGDDDTEPMSPAAGV